MYSKYSDKDVDNEIFGGLYHGYLITQSIHPPKNDQTWWYTGKALYAAYEPGTFDPHDFEHENIHAKCGDRSILYISKIVNEPIDNKFCMITGCKEMLRQMIKLHERGYTKQPSVDYKVMFGSWLMDNIPREDWIYDGNEHTFYIKNSSEFTKFIDTMIDRPAPLISNTYYPVEFYEFAGLTYKNIRYVAYEGLYHPEDFRTNEDVNGTEWWIVNGSMTY